MTQHKPIEPIAEVTAERVARLAEFAALPLPAERCAVVAATLGAWLPDANELSDKMSAHAYRDLVPATIFAHAGAQDAESQA